MPLFTEGSWTTTNLLILHKEMNIFSRHAELRQYFLKGTQNVFLYRFLSFLNHRRHTGEFVTFISKFEILLRRLASWEDTAPTYTQTSPEYVQAIQEANQRRREQHAEQLAQAQQMMAGQARGTAAPIIPDPVILDPTDPAEFQQEFIAGQQTQHTQAFPLSDNLLTLFFIIQRELTESQRERLISAMSLRGVQLPQFTYEVP